MDPHVRADIRDKLTIPVMTLALLANSGPKTNPLVKMAESALEDLWEIVAILKKEAKK